MHLSRNHSYSLTLIDSLDMLIILGNRTEFERVVKLLESNLKFDKDINVSVFETNIRSNHKLQCYQLTIISTHSHLLFMQS